MAFRSLSSLIPTADELLVLDVEELAMVLLIHLKSYEGEAGNTVYQHGMLSQTNFLALQERRGYTQNPEYGNRQPEVNRALSEAWAQLERDGILIREPNQPAPWFVISRKGEQLLSKFAQWEKLGAEQIRSDLTTTGGMRVIGGTQENRNLAWLWLGLKDKVMRSGLPKQRAMHTLSIVAESRLDELRDTPLRKV